VACAAVCVANANVLGGKAWRVACAAVCARLPQQVRQGVARTEPVVPRVRISCVCVCVCERERV